MSAANSQSTPEALILAKGLRKEYGDFTAVDGIDFRVNRGESFGFLGPNGTGELCRLAQ
jgi:lipooligosaccharide transport system ATP-binding protein